MAETKPLLDISTLAPEKLYIAIDGKNYPLKCIDEMGVRKQAQFIRMSQRLQELYGETIQQDLREAQQALNVALAADPDAEQQATIDLQKLAQMLVQDLSKFDISDAEAEEIEETVSGFIALILEAPPEVLSKLRLQQQTQIIRVFTEASGIKSLEAMENQLTGEE